MNELLTRRVIFSPVDVRATCESILSSDLFRNAPRTSRLLYFLVEKSISGIVEDTNEYSIGIEVFDRDPSHYNTCEDSIVRVQVGRLRVKLKIYFETFGVNEDIEISIPAGCYMPAFRWNKFQKNDFKPRFMLAIHPFQYISHHRGGVNFTLGLHDELVHQLFNEFGEIVVAHSFHTSGDADIERSASNSASRAEVNNRIEGSVKADTNNMRVSVRVFDTVVGSIAWSEQFNRDLSFAIPCQDELASSICGALKRFLNRQ